MLAELSQCEVSCVSQEKETGDEGVEGVEGVGRDVLAPDSDWVVSTQNLTPAGCRLGNLI